MSVYLDALAPDDARAELARCCASERWVEGMLARRPFGSGEALRAAARQVWARLERRDFLEAFAAHPRIGARPTAARPKASDASLRWSAEEQAGVGGAEARTLAELERLNIAYEERFGHVFIVCATGKSAASMLALLEGRLANEPATELLVAAAEQAKITELRLAKLGP